MWLRPHPRPCWAVARLHTSTGCSRSCLCNSEQLFAWGSLVFYNRWALSSKELLGGLHRAQGVVTPVASAHNSAQPPKWTKKCPPLSARGEQGEPLKLGFLSSDPQPARSGCKPSDATGQWVPGGGYRPPLHQTIAQSSQTSSTHPRQALESKRSSRQPSSLSNSGNCVGFQEI